MTSRLKIFTNIQVMFILQLLIPQEFEEDTIDVFVMVELASKIQDLLHNESCKLLAHGVNPIGRVNFIRDSTHLSF